VFYFGWWHEKVRENKLGVRRIQPKVMRVIDGLKTRIVKVWLEGVLNNLSCLSLFLLLGALCLDDFFQVEVLILNK
jgi:hypothetical protein